MAAPDPPYWRRRTDPDDATRLAAERRLLLTAGDLTAVGRPVRLPDGRLLLVTAADPELDARLAEDHTVTLTPCDSRGGPRPARPFDVVDPVASSRRAEPVPATARPSPADERAALIHGARRNRGGPAVETLRRLLGRPAPPPLVLELELRHDG